MATIDEKDEIKNEKQLLDIMAAKSKPIAENFAKEITRMTKDKILFLCFPFICIHFLKDFIKTKYEELLTELFIEKDNWTFQRVLHDFKEDKISISDERVMFSHPSYSEALSYLLLKDEEERIPTEINDKIFSKVLFKLEDEDTAAECVTRTIIANFDKLPDDEVRNILFKFADQQNKAAYVGRMIDAYFDSLPYDVRNELLLKLADNKKASEGVAYAVAKNFDKLPENVRNELLLKVADDNEATSDVAYAVAKNFHKLPKGVRNLLFKLADNSRIAVAHAVADNFDKLPENVRNELIRKLRL